MITRKALVEKLRGLQPGQVLFPGYRRGQPGSGGYVGYAAEKVLESLLSVTTLSQQQHYNQRGTRHENPKWLKQLYTDVAWASGDITPRSILHALGYTY